MTKYIETIKYMRVKNLGNYETERIEVSAKVPDGKTPEEVYQNLKSWVHLKLETGEHEDNDPEDFNNWMVGSDPEWYKS